MNIKVAAFTVSETSSNTCPQVLLVSNTMVREEAWMYVCEIMFCARELSYSLSVI